MAQKKVSELNNTSNVGLSDLFLLTQSLGQGEFDSLNLTASDLANWLANSMTFPLALTETTAKTLIGAINEIASNGGGGAVFLHTQLGTTTIDEDADDIYDAYQAEKALILSVLANGQYLLFACTKQTDYTIGDGVTLEFEGEVEGYKWLYVIHVDATNDTVTLERTTTELPTIEDIQELHDEIVSMLPTESASGTVASFETPLTLPLVSHNVTIDYKDTMGFSAVNVTKCGKNLVNVTNDNYLYYQDYNNFTITNNSLHITGYTLVGFIAPAKGNVAYTVKCVKSDPTAILRIREYSAKPTTWSDASFIGQSVSTNDSSATFISNAATTYVLVVFYMGGTSLDVTISNIQLELGSTATTYEPYNGETATTTITLGDTIYGGSLDVTNGTLTSTKAQDGTDLPDPVVTTITPTEINTLKGVNNIWADTGDTAVEYKQDIQTYIDSRLSSGTRSLSLAKAPVETKEETKQEEQEEKEETKTEEEVENDAER